MTCINSLTGSEPCLHVCLALMFALLSLWLSGSAQTVKTRCWGPTTSLWVSWTAVRRKATPLHSTRACAAAHTSATSTSAARPISSHTCWAEPSQSSLGDTSESFTHKLFICSGHLFIGWQNNNVGKWINKTLTESCPPRDSFKRRHFVYLHENSFAMGVIRTKRACTPSSQKVGTKRTATSTVTEPFLLYTSLPHC